MSEYQYYEFRAVDRPLTEAEMAELRALSSRATITPTSFQNEYNFGDFRGDPLTLMRKYFDAFVYVSNWGAYQFMVRLPITLLPLETARLYLIEPEVQVFPNGDTVIVDFSLQEGESEWEEGEGWLASLLPLRDELARGDLRALYIGWLSAVWMSDDEDEEVRDEDREPPLPPGMKKLSASLTSLVRFLQVDPDLVTAAAQRSEKLEETPDSMTEWGEWLRRLPENDKAELLLQVMQGKSMQAQAALLRRFREDTLPMREPAEAGGRTMRELLTTAAEYRKKRKQREQEQAARERERRAREAAEARETYLLDLAGRTEEIWLRIDALLQVRRGPEYEQAASYLVDLRDMARREGTISEFSPRMRALRARHANKPAFIRRLDAADLR
jgi:hypothetical protein